MKTTTNVIILIILVSFSCKEKKSRDLGIINPTIANEKKVYLSDITRDICYIPLSSEIPFHHILNIEVADTLIFVGSYPAGLIVFGIDGKYKYKIGRTGGGPGEYQFASKFALDNINKIIYLLDNKKVIAYTFSGEFLKQFSIEKYGSTFSDIQYLNNRLYLFEYISCGYAKYDWIIIDTSGDLISFKRNNIPVFKSQWGGNGHVLNDNDNFYYCNLYNDTIFEIHSTGYQAAFLFAQGEFRHPRHSSMLTGKFKIVYFVKTRKSFFLTYSYKGVYYTSIFDLDKGKLFVINQNEKLNHFWGGPGIINDLDGGVPIVPIYKQFIKQDEYVIGWDFAYELKFHIASEAFRNSTPKYPEKKKELEKLANSLDENDNPVLMLVKLKE